MTNTFTIGKSVIALEGRDLTNPTKAEAAFLKALSDLDEFTQTRVRIDTDQQLSEFGRLVKIKPLIDTAWRGIFRANEVIENERMSLVKKEKDLFGVPTISTPFEIAMDRECRDWFRSLSPSDLSKFFSELKAGEKHAQIVNSLLRSPVPLTLDRNLQLIEEIHHENRKALFPTAWAEVENGNPGIEWSQRGMAHLGGFAYINTRRDTAAVLLQALNEGFNLAAETMFSAESVAYAKRTGQVKSIDQAALALKA